jgi:hypothetical protein
MKKKRGRPQAMDIVPPRSPEPAAGLELEARRRQRLRTAELLGAGRTPLHVIAVAEDAVTTAEDVVGKARREHPPREPIACREGCAWCCYKTVGTSVPEVIRIVSFLNMEARQATLRRIESLPQEPVSARPPCPLLVDNRCSVYPVRPLTCRGFNSSDPIACERNTVSGDVVVPMYQPQQRIATFVLDGMRAGLAATGLSGELLELNGALRLALTVADAEERWLKGEKVFASARL